MSSGMSSVLPSLTPSPRETSGGRRRLATAWPRTTSSVRSRRTRRVSPSPHPRPAWWLSFWWTTEPRCLPAPNFSNSSSELAELLHLPNLLPRFPLQQQLLHHLLHHLPLLLPLLQPLLPSRPLPLLHPRCRQVPRR